MKIRIEEPFRFDQPIMNVTGWYTVPTASRAELFVNGRRVRYMGRDRPDVRKVFPQVDSRGFSLSLDLSEYEGDPALRFSVHADDSELASADLEITEEAREKSRINRATKSDKRDWILEHLACPNCCGANRLSQVESFMVCSSCEMRFRQGTGALNMICEDLALRADLKTTSNVSAHPYPENALKILKEVERCGGMVLDCGSGYRHEVFPRVINLEIVDYSTVDVLGVGQSLPFQSECFDAVVSLAVLEHVNDPFVCAREMMRVLKPGGTLFVVAPFLVPEHGYPDHYYNMTRSGLKNLFKELEVVEQFVEPAGHPVIGLHWMLNWYAKGLPEPQRERLLNLPFGEFIAMTRQELLADPIADLSTETMWELACTTALRARKPDRVAESRPLASTR